MFLYFAWPMNSPRSVRHLARLPHEIGTMALVDSGGEALGKQIGTVKCGGHEFKLDAAVVDMLLDVGDTIAQMARLAIWRAAGILQEANSD